LHASWTEVLELVERFPELEQINETTHAKQVDAIDERILRDKKSL